MLPLPPWGIVAAPPSPARVGIVAVEGRDRAATAQATRRTAAALALDGHDVIPDAWERARLGLPFAVPPEARRAHARIVRHIEQAEAALRRADFAAARSELAAVRNELRARPEVPDAAVLLVEALWLEAWHAHLAGRDAERDAALRRAVRLAPGIVPSPRRFPPDFLARVAGVDAGGPARPPAWAIPRGALVEIDGVFGLRPIPPGEHHVIVRVPGRGAVARWVLRDATFTVALPAPVLGPRPALAVRPLSVVCRATGAAALVVVRGEGPRTAVQAFDCAARRFRRAWTGQTAHLASVAVALEAPWATGPDPALAHAGRLGPPPRATAGPVSSPPPRDDRPRRRRWVLGLSLSAALVAVAAVIGLAVGLSAGRGPPRIAVDADGFRVAGP